MTELWLVRHGQTDWNLEGRMQGQSDIPLNEVGLTQASEAAQRLADAAFAAVYSSDLLRARVTAETIAAPHELPVRVDARLREICQGEWEGQHYLPLVEAYQRLECPEDTHRAAGGETVREVAERVRAALVAIAAAHPGQRVLVVSHGLAIATQICLARGLPLRQVHQTILDNAEPFILTLP